MLKIRIVFFLIIALLLCGCSKKGFNRGEMESAAQASRPIFVSSSLTVEQIEKLKAQIHLPIKLAVAPPIIAYGRWWGSDQELKSWSNEETAEIESWVGPLEKAGIIKDLLILPSILLEGCRYDDPGCTLRANRAAAARVQADALLMITLGTAVDEYANPISILNLTIIGMWIAPGHHRDALTVVEGAMIDNRNEYLYAFARGEAEEKIIRPFVYADTWKAVRPSRLHALQAFGREFIKQASQLKTK
jgi:hypothetical protein